MHNQILIIASDQTLRRRYAEALAPVAPPAAYQVVTVSTVTNAVWYAARRRFDLVLIEEQLRGPLNALTRLLVDHNPEVQVIVVGPPTAAMPRETRQQPGPPTLAPDCTPAELRGTVRALLSAPPTPATQSACE
jgi:hypothetical protein